MAGQVQLDGVLARLEPEALHEAVEVVDDTGVVAVDEDLGIAR
jgi:hypothetical protein